MDEYLDRKDWKQTDDACNLPSFIQWAFRCLRQGSGGALGGAKF